MKPGKRRTKVPEKTGKLPPPPRPLLSVELWCPLSGVRFGVDTVRPHKMAVSLCQNGSVYAYCPTHMVRCFMRDPATVSKLRDYYPPMPDHRASGDQEMAQAARRG